MSYDFPGNKQLLIVALLPFSLTKRTIWGKQLATKSCWSA